MLYYVTSGNLKATIDRPDLQTAAKDAINSAEINPKYDLSPITVVSEVGFEMNEKDFYFATDALRNI